MFKNDIINLRRRTTMNNNEIKCPKCGTMFQIDETNYESRT